MQALTTPTENERKITRCAIYTRVSTDAQAEVEFNSCEAQEDRIRSFIASQEGFEIFNVYSDPGFTGANMNRPALKRMIDDIRAGQIQLVITYKIDRLTRSPRDFYQMIEFLEKYQASFISVTERFDTSTPSGRLLRNIMLTFAQFERELASERVKDKVIQRVKRGLYHGGQPPYGYKAENAALVIDPPRDQIVKQIFETYVKTRSIRAILRMLKEKGILSRRGKPFGDSAIWQMLRKNVYTGKIVHKGKIHPGQHPPLISEDLFNHVQKLMTESPRFHTETHSHLPFAGIIKCGECGSVMGVAFSSKLKKNGHKYYYYRCSKVGHSGKDACGTRQIGAERLHDAVYSNLLRISEDTEYLKNLVNSHQNQTTRPRGSGVEPLPDVYNFTPELLQKNLKAFVKACARTTGIEKSLLVRKWIERVRYSKKSIGVDFVVDGPAPEVDAGRTTGRDGDSARPLDGKSPMVLDSATAARSAGNRKNSTALRVGFRPGTTTRTLSDDSARTSERPNDDSPLGLSSPEGGFTYGGGSEI
ncbi:MAG: recombinase family protein [Elusimicrobia bacterium]|nr:recombinase family protein [Elusimicrobiota bacterium]MBK7544716.1 recombinase family protein [Elusimicrobiota bacterium]MBK7688812.1 recombinase family protein [Elusimicrobiota bacterium]MBK8126378.1 recombinase family protein [Elusimicrobiota bacterium]MBK8422316.1 recombinase family protein [Elusimicrobiota bacterium]